MLKQQTNTQSSQVTHRGVQSPTVLVSYHDYTIDPV